MMHLHSFYSPASLHASAVFDQGLPKLPEWETQMTAADLFIYMQCREGLALMLSDLGLSYEVGGPPVFVLVPSLDTLLQCLLPAFTQPSFQTHCPGQLLFQGGAECTWWFLPVILTAKTKRLTLSV